MLIVLDFEPRVGDIRTSLRKIRTERWEGESQAPDIRRLASEAAAGSRKALAGFEKQPPDIQRAPSQSRDRKREAENLAPDIRCLTLKTAAGNRENGVEIGTLETATRSRQTGAGLERPPPDIQRLRSQGRDLGGAAKSSTGCSELGFWKRRRGRKTSGIEWAKIVVPKSRT